MSRSEAAFFPWILVSRTHRLPGGVRLVPYKRGLEPFAAQPNLQKAIDAIIAPYKVGFRESISRATLVVTNSKRPLGELREAKFARIRWLSEIMAFDAIRTRSYFDQLGPYCNRSHFRLIAQRFNEPSPRSVTIISRKRDGRTMSLWPMNQLPAPVPAHVGRQYTYEPDLSLLRALAGVTRNGDLRDAISCFNQANTDADDVPLSVELTLVVSALERVLESHSGKERDFLSGFHELRGTTPTLRCDSVARTKRTRIRERWPHEGFILNVWLRDLYAFRGSVAHGRNITRYPSIWSASEHLLIASFVFPLLVVKRLEAMQLISPSDETTDHLEAVESLVAHRNLLTAERTRGGQTRFAWSELVGAPGEKRRWARAVEIFSGAAGSDAR